VPSQLVAHVHMNYEGCVIEFFFSLLLQPLIPTLFTLSSCLYFLAWPMFWPNAPVHIVMFLLFQNNNTLKHAPRTLGLLVLNFQTSYISKALQLNHKIVITFEFEPPHHRRETKDPYSSPELPFMPNHYFSFLFLI